MAIFNFQKPDKVIMIDSTDFEGKFEFRPLEPGYGLTVGNALRRVMLSALEGFAITSVRIEGVDHEFSTISGIVEDVTEIILNLKRLAGGKFVPSSVGPLIFQKYRFICVKLCLEFHVLDYKSKLFVKSIPLIKRSVYEFSL